MADGSATLTQLAAVGNAKLKPASDMLYGPAPVRAPRNAESKSPKIICSTLELATFALQCHQRARGARGDG